MKNLIKIDLLGETFTFEAEKDSAKINDIVDVLVNQVKHVEVELKKENSNISKTVIITMAALNITNEHHETKEQYSSLLQVISNKIESLNKKLDACMN